MNKNLFAICITLIAITLIICTTNYMTSIEEGDRVRNLLKLQQNAALGLYRQPGYEPKQTEDKL